MIEQYEKYRSKLDFIKAYSAVGNAASGSKFDPNANVDSKNIATLDAELPKEESIGINRLLMSDMLTELFGKEWAESYLEDLEDHLIYVHDETHVMMPYCVSLTLYPFLMNGLKSIGGISGAPKHLDSFCGEFINLIFAVAAQFAGAVSTPEWLSYMDYFIRKEYGEDYRLHADEVVDGSNQKKTIRDVIASKFQQIVHSLNQPAGARGFQSTFWNIAYFDAYYFEGLFEGFVFPDGTPMNWESVQWLQEYFMKWFNAERLITPLTFPVETVNSLTDGQNPKDERMADFVAEMWAEGHSFFWYNSDSVDSLASCCRLRNGITENSFSYTLGAGGIATGSKKVITMNINRIVQQATRDGVPISQRVAEITERVHKYLLAYNELLKRAYEAKLLPVYEAGFITMSKQYLTVGLLGVIEGAESLGIEISDNQAYREYGEQILKPIYELNKAHKTKEIMFNTESIPGESLGVKLAHWDSEDGYFVPRDCYNSYFYIVEDEGTTPVDKLILHGKQFTQYLDGGSAVHINLAEHLSKEQYRKMMLIAIREGANYITFNIPNTICNECGHISKHRLKACPKCGSEDVDYLTRIIGYLKRVKHSFSAARQKEESRRYYASGNIV